MTTYKTVRDINFNDQIIPANRVFTAPEGEENKATVERFIAKGSIVEYEGEQTEGEVAPETVAQDHSDANVPAFTPESTPVVGEATQPTEEQIAEDLKAHGVQ